MRNAVILGTGLYAPGRPVPNSVFDARYGQDISSFLVKERNIHFRHFMAEDEATSDLAVQALRQAMERCGCAPSQLKMIIVATDTPDYISPPTAAVVQYKLGAQNAGVLDVNAACAGFVTALDLARSMMGAHAELDRIAVVGTYGMSRFLDDKDYKTSSLFADGAGAVILGPADAAAGGIRAARYYADGAFHDYMGIYAGGAAFPTTESRMRESMHKLQFVKKIPVETNPTHWPRLIREVTGTCGWEPVDVDRYFMTQINIGGIRQTLDSLGVQPIRSHNIMDRYAYTGSACIPMAIADADSRGILRPRDKLVLMASGGGMAMAAMALEWGAVS